LLALVAALCVVETFAEQRRALPRRQPRPQGTTLPVVLSIEDSRAQFEGDLIVLIDAARADGSAQIAAIRALGRLERRDVIADLLPLLTQESTRAETANALAQALRGERLNGVPYGQHEQVVLDALLAAGASELLSKKATAMSAVARSIGRLPFSSAAQVKSAETFLRRLLETPFPPIDEPQIAAARALESLARLNRKSATLDEDTIYRLRLLARSSGPLRIDHRRNAMAALIASQGVDADTLRITLEDADVEVRRLAVISLGGAGSSLPEDDRVTHLLDALEDPAFMVRIEAVRGWARRATKTQGCRPLLEAIDDKNLHVALVTLDLLADQCTDDANVTNRLVSIAKTPGMTGSWLREAHALVSLARRAPDRAALPLATFAFHTNWHVRMYAARAAAILGRADVLLDLADDPDDNVVEAALPMLRKLLGAESDQAFVAALNRRNRTTGRTDVRPYQALRAAAIALEGAAPTPALAGALADALERVSTEQCETSRDTRLALLARLAELGSENQAAAVSPLLRDIDPLVATAAAGVLTRWTGKPAAADLPPLPTPVPPAESAIARSPAVLVEMEGGGKFEIHFNESAPLTRMRFLELVDAGYYDGTAFHRVVPNFVVQGGGPNSNEYCGACPFARDEVGLAMHTRGTIGVSTRGRDTGDMQIFINLVDNPRLDHDFTVFGRVCRAEDGGGMDTVDHIAEGDRMMRLTTITAERSCR
jgi:cyclophilin family peptidyl-prolyl cis-trans isomerase/HEAT repeat protein